MTELPRHDHLCVETAQGWCELHSYLEANEELDKVTPSLRAHPKVLEIRWQVYQNLEKFEAALDIAKAIRTLEPEWVDAWIYEVETLTELGRNAEAHAVLAEGIQRFPDCEILHYFPPSRERIGICEKFWAVPQTAFCQIDAILEITRQT